MNATDSKSPEIRPLRHPSEFAGAAAVRRAVFVVEQNCPEEEEFDHWEAASTHFVVVHRGDIVGTARIYHPQPGVAKFGRIALLPEARGRGWGRALMHALEEYAAALGLREVTLDAQVQIIPFYEGLGYRAEGPEFLDANIPHRLMRRALNDE